MSRTTLALDPLDPPEAGLRLIGELDLATVPALKSALGQVSADDRVTLDLSELTFVDSTGLHAILEYAPSLDGGGPLILANPSDIALRALEIVGFLDHAVLEVRKDPHGE